MQLGGAGSYILSPRRHTVEGDVPLENMLAFIETAHRAGGGKRGMQMTLPGGDAMTPRQRFIAALNAGHSRACAAFRAGLLLDLGGVRQAPSLPAQLLAVEKKWRRKKGRQLHRMDMADLYIATAERFDTGASSSSQSEQRGRGDALIDIIREKTATAISS